MREVMIIAWQRVREQLKRYQSSQLPTYLPGNLKIFLVFLGSFSRRYHQVIELHSNSSSIDELGNRCHQRLVGAGTSPSSVNRQSLLLVM